MKRVTTVVLGWRDDVVVAAGIGLVGYGAGQLHPALAPIVWGLGLVAMVRWGVG